MVLKDGDWQISGDGQLGHVKFIMAAPSIAAAESWLALADDGRYAESWDAAAEFLKNAVGKDNFVKSLNAARKPLGKLKSREIKSKEFRTSLPGAERRVRSDPIQNLVREQGGERRDSDADARQGQEMAGLGVLHQVARQTVFFPA